MHVSFKFFSKRSINSVKSSNEKKTESTHRMAHSSQFVDAAAASLGSLNLHTDADLKLLAPRGTKDLLKDLDVLPEFERFPIKYGDVFFIQDREHCYTTLNEILEDIQSIQKLELVDQEALTDRILLLNRSHNREWAKTFAGVVCRDSARLHFGAHVRFARLLDQLSSSARESLVAGLKIQDVTDAWENALQERNYAILERRNRA